MNITLTEAIIEHIFASLGIIQLPFLSIENSKSIMTNEFLLDQKLVFQNDSEQTKINNIYGCQFAIENKEFNILIGDCSQDNILEIAMVAQLTDSPAYGLYLICDNSMEKEPMIIVSLNGKNWLPCSTFLQATFLAAMEQLKDTGISATKCANYQPYYQMLLSIINFHQQFEIQ